MLDLSSRFLALAAFSTLATAQFAPDQRWTNPNGSYPDFTVSYSQGQVVTLSWTALNNSVSDLWLTNYNNVNSTFNKSLGTNINISIAGSLQWTVNIDESVRAASNEFNLRFFPAGAAYGVLQFQQNISPGFFVNTTSGAVAGSSTSSTASSSTTGTSMTTSIVSQSATGTSSAASSSATAAGASSSGGGGLSTGAKAGIGVGVSLGVIGLFILGLFVGRKYRISRVNNSPPSYAARPATTEIGTNDKQKSGTGGAGAFFNSSVTTRSKPGEVEGDFAHPQELASSGRGSKPIAELDSRQV